MSIAAKLPLYRGRCVPINRRLRMALRGFRRDQDGVTAVEFGMVSIPFFAILFAIVEAAIMFWSAQVLETAVANAARTIYTGQFQTTNDETSSDIGAKFKTELCKHVVALFPCNTSALRVDIRRFTPGTPPPAVIDKNTGNIDEGAFGYQATKPSEIVLVRAALELPAIAPFINWNQTNLANGKRLILGTATFRNEPF